MKVKTKIIIIIASVLVEAGLLTGAVFYGRSLRYTGTTQVGEDAKENIEQVETDLDKSGELIDLSIPLLNPVVQSNILMMQTMETLKSTNTATTKCLDDFVDMLATSQTNIDNFAKSYQGSKKSEEYALDLMIKQAEELESIQKKYVELLVEYNKLKGEQ